MANSLFNAFNGNNANPYAQLVTAARQLKQQITTNPRDEVQRLLNSGQISQEQFNSAMNFAQNFIASNRDKFN